MQTRIFYRNKPKLRAPVNVYRNLPTPHAMKMRSLISEISADDRSRFPLFANGVRKIRNRGVFNF
jgi:hypothetical protein